jgi:putative acetyltransferase
MDRLETKRLILRPFLESDLEDFFEYCTLETVGPNAGWAVHENKLFSLKIIQSFIEKGDVLALVHKGDNKVIGSVGLHKKTDEFNKTIYEIGYVLSTPYEGCGLMTETVKRVLQHAFMDLDLPRVMVCHFIGNDKSRRVIEKCGFVHTHFGEYKTLNFGVKKSKYYILTKDNYIKNREE